MDTNIWSYGLLAFNCSECVNELAIKVTPCYRETVFLIYITIYFGYNYSHTVVHGSVDT